MGESHKRRAERGKVSRDELTDIMWQKKSDAAGYLPHDAIYNCIYKRYKKRRNYSAVLRVRRGVTLGGEG